MPCDEQSAGKDSMAQERRSDVVAMLFGLLGSLRFSHEVNLTLLKEEKVRQASEI